MILLAFVLLRSTTRATLGVDLYTGISISGTFYPKIGVNLYTSSTYTPENTVICKSQGLRPKFQGFFPFHFPNLKVWGFQRLEGLLVYVTSECNRCGVQCRNIFKAYCSCLHSWLGF